MDFTVAEWNHRAQVFYKSKGCVDLTEKEKFHCFRLPEDVMKSMANNTESG